MRRLGLTLAWITFWTVVAIQVAIIVGFWILPLIGGPR